MRHHFTLLLCCTILAAGEAELPEAARKALDGMRVTIDKARTDYAAKVKDENQKLIKILKAEQDRQTKAGKLEEALAMKDLAERAQRGEFIEPLLNPSAENLLGDNPAEADGPLPAGLPRGLAKGLVLSISFEQAEPTAVLARGTRKLAVEGTWQAVEGVRGKGARIDRPTFLTLDGNGLLPLAAAPRTLAVWFQTQTDRHGQSLAEYGTIEQGRRWSMLLMDNGRYYFACENLDLPVGGSGLTDGRWHHMVFAYDGRTANGYVDGQPVGSRELAINTAAGPLFLGRNSNPEHRDGEKLRDGAIDEVMLWNRALSAKEVAALHQAYAKP